MPTQYGSVWTEHQNLYRVRPCYIHDFPPIWKLLPRSILVFFENFETLRSKTTSGGKRTDVIFSGKIQWFQLQDQGHNNIKADFSGLHSTGLHLRPEIRRSTKTKWLLDQDLSHHLLWMTKTLCMSCMGTLFVSATTIVGECWENTWHYIPHILFTLL